MTYTDKAGNVPDWYIVERKGEYGVMRNDLMRENDKGKYVCIQWADKTATVILASEAIEVIQSVAQSAYEALALIVAKKQPHPRRPRLVRRDERKRR